MLKELLRVRQLAKFVDRYEEVFAALRFARPRLSRGVRDRQAQLRPPFEKRLHERRFPRARGSCDDKQAAA